MDEDGYYFWKGRIDDMFVCKGNNIFPVEVEKALMLHPSISGAIVAPIVDKFGLTMPAAALVKKSDSPARM